MAMPCPADKHRYHLHMDLLKPLITLLAIVNPLGVIPFFIHYTQGYTREQRQRTILISAFTTFCVIAISAIAGLQILEFFGITLASFQVGGGLLLMLGAMSMLNAEPAEGKSAKESSSDSIFHANAEDAEALTAARTSIAVVPLAIPLLTGPATMSTMVIYAEKAKLWWQLATLVGYGVVVALAVFIAFTAARPIAKLMGQTGINVMTRLMGLILAALAVEVMADGLVKLFPILAK
jgi:multiple antibiotic resistance protein